MKRLFNSIIISLFAAVSIFAQQQPDGRIAFFSVVNNQSGTMPQAAVSALESKMQQMVTADGYGSAARGDRFVIVAKPSVITKDVAQTTPLRINQTVEITFVVGDVVENKTYASCALTLTGIGIKETKAWNTAIAKIKPANEEIKRMLTDAHDKIGAYYSANCNSIMAKAETEAGLGNFDEAIASLMDVPDICAECFAKAQQKAVETYQRKIDDDGANLLSRAKSEWAAQPDSNGAQNALAYLSQIDPTSASFAAKNSLEQEIATKLSADEQRKWEDERKRYNEELKLRQKEQQNSHRRKMATIAACRSVAEKWAENQPKTKVYLNW